MAPKSAGRKCRSCGVWKPADDYAPGRKGGAGRSCMPCLEAIAYKLDAAHERERERHPETWHDGRRWMRRCSLCDEVKPLRTGFYRAAKHAPEQPPINSPKAVFMGKCKVCHAAEAYKARKRRLEDPVLAERERVVNREKQRREREAKPERQRAHRKASYHRMKADPERHARTRELARINYRLRQERKGIPPRKTKQRKVIVSPSAREREHVPVEPMLAFFDKRVEQRKLVEGLVAENRNALVSVVGAVCEDLGISDRVYRHWRNGGRVRIATVEGVLLNAGVEWHDVYSYDDHAAAFIGEGVEA